MINVNILTKFSHENFLHQLDKVRYDGKFAFYENSNKNIEWDLVVVYEGINKAHHLKVKEGGLLFISGEPPTSSVYPRKFLKQFDWVISSHRNLKHPNNILSQQALNWHFGFDFKHKSYRYNFEDLSKLRQPLKTKNISIVSSSKKMMPGHNKRMKLIEMLKEKFPNEIDFFGKDENPIDVKADAILPYRFHICIENSFINDYWTEKFADPILGYSIPIYIGCTNIEEYFPENFYFSFNIKDSHNLCKLIEKIKYESLEIYNNKYNSIIEARNKLLNVYNIFPMLENHYNNHKTSPNKVNETLLKPSTNFNSYKYLLSKLRIKRFLYRIMFNIKY